MTPETYLSSRLQDDIGWRIKELSEIVRACVDARGTRQEALLRASVPVLYAHWEGYFVFATNSYLNFVADKRTMISALKDQFGALTIRKKIHHQQINSDTSLMNFLLQIRAEVDRSFKKGNFERINGQSNLNSDVLTACCKAIGISIDCYAVYFDFIDKDLIDRRNHIAHGASLRFESGAVGPFRDKVVELMRITQTEIENSVSAGTYLR